MTTPAPPLTIHAVSYASQPYVTIDCTGKEHYVKAGEAERLKLPPEVYATGDGVIYTFEPLLVTCHACKEAAHG